MICIFLVLYFGVLLVAHKKRFRSIGLFVVYSLLAGGIAAVLLLPEVCALLETDFGDMLFPEEMEFYFSIPEVFARHSFLVLNERGLAHWPNIYCGSAVYMLLPMYLLNHKISLREKLGKVAILGIFLLSFSTNVLDFIWHGMNYPDSLPARQSFLYCFLVVTMCYEAYYRVKEVRLWQILVGYFVGTAFLVYSMIFVDSRHYLPGSRALTLLFMTAFAILLCLYRVREEATFRKVVAFLALVAVVVECSVNTGCTSINNTGRSAYLKSLDDYENLYLQTQEKEEGFYRLEKFHRKTKNDSMLSNYPSATVFSSTMNSYVMDMYERLGMRYSKVYYSFDGATALSGALLSVHYMFGDSHEYENSLYTLVGQSGDVYLYEANTRLPFGWVGPTGFDLPDSPRAIGLHNDLAVSLGIKDRFFTYEGGKASGNDVAFTAKTKGIYYAIMTAGGTSQVTYTGGPAGEETFTDIKDGRIVLLGELEAGQSILLKNADEDDDTPKLYASIYRMNEEVLQQVIAILSEQHMENVVCESDFVSGEITLEKAGRLVLSVPYEAGWDVRINGKEAEGSLFGGCLMAFDLEPGHYEIEMHNTAKGFYQGLALTGGSLAVYLLLLLLEKKKKAHEEEQIVVENTATL
jgi:uncharacterized membrane protein YfhO